MTIHLFKGCAAVICDPHSVLRDVDLLVEGPRITAIGKGLIAPSGADVIDARGWFLYPGLVNTHHHFFQTFVRNRADLDWTKLSVIQWLDLIYPIFSRLTEDCFYHSSLTAMAELAKHGCMKQAADLGAIGFKSVHAKGVTGAQLVTPRVLEAMEAYNEVAPAHNPPYVAAMRLLAKEFPRIPLVAAFETGFHQIRKRLPIITGLFMFRFCQPF